MRRPFFVRLSVAACGTLAIWLFSAPAAEAAPAPRRHARVVRCLCDARSMARRVRARGTLRMVRPVGRYLVRTHRFVQRHPTAWLQRRPANPVPGHDAAALQNSADALGGDDLLLLTALEPLGLL